jgi:hypothetical protein
MKWPGMNLDGVVSGPELNCNLHIWRLTICADCGRMECFMGILGEFNRPMTGDDHTSICRFKSADARYHQVLSILQDFAQGAVQSQ